MSSFPSFIDLFQGFSNMDILFLHPSFPGQFARLAPLLAKSHGVSVCAMGDTGMMKILDEIPNIPLIKYSLDKLDGEGVHPYARNFNNAIQRATVVAHTLIEHKYQGYEPDVIFVHPGWGDSLYLKEVYPHAKVIGLLEFYYHFRGADVGFDKEFPPTIHDVFNVKSMNATHALALDGLDRCFSPTQWQRSRFPAAYQDKIDVIHDGIDTDRVRPNSSATYTLPNGSILSLGDEVVTFVNRDLEPYRGYHKFMRALPAILKERPQCQVVIVGGDGVSYGKRAPQGTTWKQRFFDEVRDKLDLSRVHFTGKIPYNEYLKLLQISSVHVYLTYPFVLSWSMLEAMSAGCIVLGSSTAPVEEVIEDGKNGFLVPFEDSEQISHKVINILANSNELTYIRDNARSTVISNYDFQKVTLPLFKNLIQSVCN